MKMEVDKKQMPQNVYELVSQTYEEFNINNGNETYANCLIKVLKKHHLWPSMQVKKFKNNYLVLLHNTYQRDDVSRFKQLYDQCRSLVLDFSQNEFTNANNVVVSYSNNIPERIQIEDYVKNMQANDKYQEAIDGTMITVYYFGDQWHFGTSCCTDAYLSKFGNSNKSHGHLFNEVLLTYFHQHFTSEEINTNDPTLIAQISQRLRDMFTSHLDTTLAYEFVVVHYENIHIIDYSTLLGQAYKSIYHINTKNRQTLEEMDIYTDKPLLCLGVKYATCYNNLNDAYNDMQTANNYGFIAKTYTQNGVHLYKISPKEIELKESTDPCNPNVWHNILTVYMKNKKEYKINDYIKMYAPNLQLPNDDKGKPLDPTYLIHTMISTLKDVLYNLYIATTTYNSKSKKFRMNKELDQQFPPVIRFHLAQLRYRQQFEHSAGLIKPKDVYYYLCHCNNIKNIKLLITFLSTSVGYNISERGALCLTVLNGLL